MLDKDLKILNLQAKLSAAYTHLHTLTANAEIHEDSCPASWYDWKDCKCINLDIREAIEFITLNTDDIQQLIIPIYDI